MINNGKQKGVYLETEDNTLRDLKGLQDFFYQNIKNKHESIDEINIQSLNFRPIIAQTRACT